MMNMGILGRAVLGAGVLAVVASAGPLLATPAVASPACQHPSPADGCGPDVIAPISQVLEPVQPAVPSGPETHPMPAGFGQVAAAPVHTTAPIHQVVGSVGAPLVNVNIPCPAPWNQGGVAGADYNACNAAPVFQQEGSVSGVPGAHPGSGFSQVAAAPVDSTAPISQVVGSVGAPLVNVNVPCPAPWQQGGVAGSDYNACNTAPVFQQEGPVQYAAPAGPSAHPASGFGQVAAAPVHTTAPISQVLGSVGAPLVNLNVPCPAPWQQGGVAGSDYNACNTAPVFQQEGSVLGTLMG